MVNASRRRKRLMVIRTGDGTTAFAVPFAFWLHARTTHLIPAGIPLDCARCSGKLPPSIYEMKRLGGTAHAKNLRQH